MMYRKRGFILAFVTLGIGLAGCGSGASGSLTSAQASAFAMQVSQVAAQGMVDSTAGSESSISCTQSACTADIPVSYMSECPSGGAMLLSGGVRGPMPGSSGSGMIGILIPQTITDWSCVSGLVINGDPNLSVSGQLAFVLLSPATVQSMTITGDFDWGAGSSEKCSVNLAVGYNFSGTGTTSGTVCNQSVNASFTFQQP
jgi:hypothetical protein